MQPYLGPHLSKDTHMLENIQRRAARFIKGDFRTTTSVTKMLQELGLKDLKDRHRLALLFKVVQGHVGVSPEDIGLEPVQTIYINSEPEEQELTHIYIYIYIYMLFCI